MALESYRDKRRFARTPEPTGGPRHGHPGPLRFVVQKHAARRLHYDFRLELNGVLKSWAVPKGPSLDPGERRLAMAVEDHPLEYADFEGTIPAGEYGAGAVMVWDRGYWFPEGDPDAALAKGHLELRLEGSKLRGRWHLVRTSRTEEPKQAWLLIKKKDALARPATNDELLRAQPLSVVSGRDLEAIAGEPERTWSGKDEAGLQGSPPAAGHPDRIPGAKAAPRGLPVEPELATEVDKPPPGRDWLHEVKLDGYRILCHKDGTKLRLLTRHGNDWTASFPRLEKDASLLTCSQAILDGEAVALNAHGVSDFQALQNAMTGGNEAVTYFAFDLLYLDGYDLRSAPLMARKEALRLLLVASPVKRVRYTDHVEGRGAEFLREVRNLGLEGIVSKRAASPYRGGRTRDWLKVKCKKRQELVVVGYTDPSGSRVGLGALLLAVHDDAGRLVYAGRVGTGLRDSMLAELRRELELYARRDPPVVNPPVGKSATRGFHWVEPRMVVEVAFTEWTRDGILRQPTLVGVRRDTPAGEVGRERPQPVQSVVPTNPSESA